MQAATRPPEDEITTAFETLSTPPESGAGTGDPVCRGTHQYDSATVERTYHVTVDGQLVAETAFIDGDRTVEVVDECWLLSDGRLAHTGERIGSFCRDHHASDPATDLAFCLSTAPKEHDIDVGDVTSTFQPATEVTVEDGLPLRYTGCHEAGEASVERRFFVDETGGRLRVRTAYHWAGDRLGTVSERQALGENGEFVTITGEPVAAFCRRTHLADPKADLRYCTRLGRTDATPDG